jgi:PTH1 family peptidyl-tRNA hydrolase
MWFWRKKSPEGPLKLVVGLGNPGTKYEGTRHNLGFDVVDVLAGRHDIAMTSEKFHAWFGRGEVAGHKVALLKPTTFMNRCGQAVGAAVRFYKLPAEELMVIADDLALPVGRLRIRGKGSAGSHNGLQNIIDHLGSEAWPRLRIGIGAPVGMPSSYVLTRFQPQEEEIMQRARRWAADAVECWIQHGADLAMTRFNGDPPESG